MTNRFSKAIRIITDSDYRFQSFATRGLYNQMDDRKYIERLFKAKMDYELNLDNPVTFNEKIQWLKINDRNPLYTKLVDKYTVKEIVAAKIGKEYIIPTIGVWESFANIDFSNLPERFVLKSTHDSGGIVICEDKSTFNYRKAKKQFDKRLNTNYFPLFREWPYKDVIPRIIAEEYMQDSQSADLKDYKFFCFNGNPKAMFVASDRQNPNEETKFDFFDMEFNHLPFINGHPNSSNIISKPKSFDEMVGLAKILSENIPHVRVDFYEINGKVYFGELTFYHWSGLTPFQPSEWDEIFGRWLILPDSNIY